MSSNKYNYLSLDGEEDEKQPLIRLCSDKSFHKKDEDIKDYGSQQKPSIEESFQSEQNVDIYRIQQDEAIKKLTWVCLICSIFIFIEIIGGYIANSIAIMSDAAHLLSDLLGFIISIISIYISRKIAKNNMSYGYHRAEIIGELVSIVLIWL